METEDAPFRPPRAPTEGDGGGSRVVADGPPVGVGLAVARGHLLAYRMYDAADEIDLGRVEAALRAESSRLRLLRENSKYLELRNPPVSLSLGMRELQLSTGVVSAELRVRVYDHGAISCMLRIPLQPGLPFEALIAFADAVYDAPPIDALCRAEVAGLSQRLGPALRSPHLWEQDESYTVTFVEAFEGGPATADQVLARCDLARLLLGEKSATVSRQQRQDVLNHQHSYLTNDLAVIDWNSAFVYEPSGIPDIPDILEIANAQLLELRYYDDLLDRELDAIYDEVNLAKRPWWSIFSSKYSRLRRRTLALTLELGEFTERVENALKIIGDFYLARVYQSAVRRFRISDWSQSVYRKETSVAQVYSLLKSEVDTDRLLWLEITVVILILGELLLALHVV
jgi:hypothetical protein